MIGLCTVEARQWAMARKRMSEKKVEPAVMSLFFKPGGLNPSTSSTEYLDLSMAVSIANRRFYRQGLNWAIGSIKIMSYVVDSTGNVNTRANPSGRVSVSKVPTTWISSNSWEKAFRHWQKMNKQSDGVPGKFHDFKVLLDEAHYDKTVKSMLPFAMPNNGDITTLGTSIGQVGDWDYSHFVIPEAGAADPSGSNEYDIMFVGDNYPSSKPVVSLIQGYANSRAIGAASTLDPNTPGEMDDSDGPNPENWLSAVFNEGQEQDSDVVENLQQENVQAPYPFENDADGNTVTQYPGGQEQLNGPQIHAIEPITGSTIGGTTYIQGGQFPCGLVRFDLANYTTESGEYLQNVIQIDLVPGDHRGYLCESMVGM